ncbi:discoidin domain-containing protein [Lentisphaera profundi]|uniref:Discoidin domain-containing protein n=1 Tax=Lentisphaera profundi TaxID=1658616 RepID=A0ABY7W0E6_9BACT|nr:discoidin domain-containing protein [Lentisphaera profundi]WDE99427.1 discoidin domain-containing protein [Lentisphaera profundi]
MIIKTKSRLLSLSLILFSSFSLYSQSTGLAKTLDPATKPIKALLIAGGCCHDYEAQTKILSDGIQKRANIRVDVYISPSKSPNPPLPLYDDPNWAKGYDLIIHDECAAGNRDNSVVDNILNVHKTIPAVHLHCAMHSFRGSKNTEWCKHIGLKSTRHGPHLPVAIEVTNKNHPITKNFKNWVTGKEELYNNTEVYTAEPLLKGTQKYNKKGEDIVDTATVAWVNTQYGARSFSTSLGHYNEVVASDEYLELVSRGALWACNKLDDENYLLPYTGSNLITIINEDAKQKIAPQPKPAPADATFVTLSASSTQSSNKNYMANAIDNDPKTRWCANAGTAPAWLQVQFDKAISLSAAQIEWEMRDEWTRYKIETSLDGKKWNIAFDASNNTQGGVRKDLFNAQNIKYLRVVYLKQKRGMWPSFWELSLFDSQGKKLKLHESGQKATKPLSLDLFKKEGNYKAHPHRLSATEEAELLKDVSVPAGFEKSLFAPWQMANYPTYVAAAPNGDLYVSSDGNASGNRSPRRGRVLRLRDTDADGRADEVTEFVRDIDSPRGIVWDHDRLYVLHPPHITVFHDQDGDGVADSSKRLISNIAFGFKDRSADHTTNGLDMGVDGWIYIAVGDFGFMNATGTDGRELQLRGGGVVRFRPDGTGMELFSAGTRNIYGLAITPSMEMFSRDNTNDGGGWDVRFHQHTGLEDHGYPRLYINFQDEIVAPLADYGGGSGVGAFYLGEPGIPAAWNKFPYTCDWGRQGSYRHTLSPNGAGFKEISKPELLIKMTRPTDGDVDGLSNIYQASWKGAASFFWKGPELGYIAKVRPTNYQAKALPDFAKLSDDQLIAIISSSKSHIRRINAQRMLLRKPFNEQRNTQLLKLAQNASLPLENRIVALYATSQYGLDSRYSEKVLALLLAAFKDNDALMPILVRACGDMAIDLRTQGKEGPTPNAFLTKQLSSTNPRTVLEAIVAAVRQGKTGLAPVIAQHLASADPLLAHTSFQALAQLQSIEVGLKYIQSEDPKDRMGASHALMRIHQSETVQGLLEILAKNTDSAIRKSVISTLARLYHREAKWQGDSWSTRPDTRGPYYQLDTWESSDLILNTLNTLLEDPSSSKDLKSHIVAQLGKNRIQNDRGLKQILKLANDDPSLLPTVLNQLVDKEAIPVQANELIIAAAFDPNTSATSLQQAIQLLVKIEDPKVYSALIAALSTLIKDNKAVTVRGNVRKQLFNSPKLENFTDQFILSLNTQTNTSEEQWAAQALLHLAKAKGIGKEAQHKSRAAIDKAWQNDLKKANLIQAAHRSKNSYLNDRIRLVTNHSNKTVVAWAKTAVRSLRIQMPGADKTAKISTLKAEEAIAQASAYKKGDIALGEAIFSRASCVACHTVSQDEAPKGPYLGSIASILRRQELAEAIILPNKAISQGFSTQMIALKNGQSIMGFVTNESGDSISMRDISSKQHDFKKSEIASRQKLPTSLMPAGLMNTYTLHEFASLLDYLAHLAKKDE